MRPLLTFYFQTDPDESLGLSIENNGPGPAIIKSVTYFLDHKRMTDEYEAFQIAKIDPDLVQEIDLDEDDSIGAGQSVWLLRLASKKSAIKKHFLDVLDNHLSIAVNYCSIDNDCQMKCSDKEDCSARQSK